MKRRKFMGIGAFFMASAGFGPAFGAMSGKIGWEAATLADLLLRAYPKQMSAVAVGDAYLQEVAARPALNGVVDALMVSLDAPASRLHQLTSADLRARLKARTVEDFELGRTVRVKGWVLGETEARLCGLAALRAA